MSHREHDATPGETAALRALERVATVLHTPCPICLVNKVTSGPLRQGLTLAVSAPWPAGKHTANSHRLSALVTPAGKSYECQAQQTISLISSDHQKSVQLLLSEVRIQPFDITADFVFSEGKAPGEGMFCIPNTLPLPQPLGTSFAQGIWVPPLSQHHLLPPVSFECSLKSFRSLPCLHGFQSLYELSPAVIWSQCVLSLHVGWLL